MIEIHFLAMLYGRLNIKRDLDSYPTRNGGVASFSEFFKVGRLCIPHFFYD